MAFTSYADIYDPENILQLVGNDWINEARIAGSPIVVRDMRPTKGTRTSEIRQTLFQDTTGQAIAAGGTIASQKETQNIKYHPVVWRYQAADQPDVINEITVNDVPKINADMAGEIRKAAAQYVDNSAVEVIKSTGAALTANQFGTGLVTLSLTELVNTKAKLLDNGELLTGGAIVMRNEPFYKLVKLGLVAATSNTFGNAHQDQMVSDGKLPNTVLGMSPYVTDKFASLGSDKYYIYLIGTGALRIRGNDTPEVEVAKDVANKRKATITLISVSYGIGFDGMNWGGAGSEQVTDTSLGTSGNWSLGAGNAKHVPICRLHTTI